MPVQLDGSRHAWLEDQGPKFVLLLAVDDAPGICARGETFPARPQPPDPADAPGTRGETSQATGFGVAILL